MVDNNNRHAQSGYLFSEYLDRYLQEKLRIEKLKLELGNKLSEKLDVPRIKANDKNKVKVLNNHVFRSMANLIYFFEFINKHQELEGVFDSDVEDLFGFKGPHVKRHNVNDGKYLVFLRFLDAIINYDNTLIVEESDDKTLTKSRMKKKEFDTGRNFRLQLIRDITDAALESIQNIAGEKEGTTPSVARLKIGKIISQDLERTRIWKDYYCTSEIKLNTNNPHRKIRF